MDWLLKQLVWVYGKWFVGRELFSYFVVCGAAVIAASLAVGLLWSRAIDAYREQHLSPPFKPGPPPAQARGPVQVGDQVGRIEDLLTDVRDPAYRQLVAAVIYAFDPKASVAVGSLVGTPDGTRTVDVEIRSPDRTQLIAVDVVDLPGGRKAGVEVVDAADSKRTDLKAEAILVCSNTGFDATAIQKAKRKRIGLISVLRQGDQRIKARIEEEIYLRRVNIAPVTLTYEGATVEDRELLKKFMVGAHDLTYAGRSVASWLQHRAAAIVMAGQVRALLDNFDGDALGIWRTAGRMRSA